MGNSKILTLDDIRKINFGAPAAERDINQGLVDYFLVSGTYNRVRSGKKTVILGNRGIGKSAILKMLAVELRAAGHIVIELAPEDYSYEILSQSLAKESEGMTGADIAAICMEASMLSIREYVENGGKDDTKTVKKCKLNMKHFQEAFKKVKGIELKDEKQKEVKSWTKKEKVEKNREINETVKPGEDVPMVA